MTKKEIIEYLYENNVRGDLTIEQMAEDLADNPQKEYKRGRLDALSELKAYIREMGTYCTADTPQTDVPRCSINGTPFDECGFCEHFNCDTCQCTADTPQTERSEK